MPCQIFTFINTYNLRFISYILYNKNSLLEVNVKC